MVMLYNCFPNINKITRVRLQTFLPYPSFEKSVEALDYRRLGKQRVEAMQILQSLVSNHCLSFPEFLKDTVIKPLKEYGWGSHAAVRMWVGFEKALAVYFNNCVIEWTNRGYRNNLELIPVEGHFEYPYWIGDDKFHSSHRAALLFKDFSFYSKFGWSESPGIRYYWPESANGRIIARSS